MKNDIVNFWSLYLLMPVACTALMWNDLSCRLHSQSTFQDRQYRNHNHSPREKPFLKGCNNYLVENLLSHFTDVETIFSTSCRCHADIRYYRPWKNSFFVLRRTKFVIFCHPCVFCNPIKLCLTDTNPNGRQKLEIFRPLYYLRSRIPCDSPVRVSHESNLKWRRCRKEIPTFL